MAVFCKTFDTWNWNCSKSSFSENPQTNVLKKHPVTLTNASFSVKHTAVSFFIFAGKPAHMREDLAARSVHHLPLKIKNFFMQPDSVYNLRCMWIWCKKKKKVRIIVAQSTAFFVEVFKNIIKYVLICIFFVQKYELWM